MVFFLRAAAAASATSAARGDEAPELAAEPPAAPNVGIGRVAAGPPEVKLGAGGMLDDERGEEAALPQPSAARPQEANGSVGTAGAAGPGTATGGGGGGPAAAKANAGSAAGWFRKEKEEVLSGIASKPSKLLSPIALSGSTISACAAAGWLRKEKGEAPPGASSSPATCSPAKMAPTTERFCDPHRLHRRGALARELAGSRQDVGERAD